MSSSESELRKELIAQGFPRYKIETVLRKAQTLDACLHLLDEDTRKEEERKRVAAEKRAMLEHDAQETITEENEFEEQSEEKDASEELPPLVAHDEDTSEQKTETPQEDADEAVQEKGDDTQTEPDDAQPPVEEAPAVEPEEKDEDDTAEKAEEKVNEEDDAEQDDDAPVPEGKDDTPEESSNRPEGGLHPLDLIAKHQQEQEQQEEENDEEDSTAPEDQQIEGQEDQHVEQQEEQEDEPSQPTEESQSTSDPPAQQEEQKTPQRPTVNISETLSDIKPHEILTPATKIVKNLWVQNFEVECVKLSQPIVSLRMKIEDKEYDKTGVVAEILRSTLFDFQEKYGFYKKTRLQPQKDLEDKADSLMGEATELLESYDEHVRPISEVHMVKNAIKESKKLIPLIEDAIVLRNVRSAALYRDQLLEKCKTLVEVVGHNGGGAADARVFLDDVDNLKNRLKSEFKTELADEDIFNISQKMNTSIKNVYKALSNENIPDARKAKSDIELFKKQLAEYSSFPKAAKVLTKADDTIKAYDDTVPVILASIQ